MIENFFVLPAGSTIPPTGIIGWLFAANPSNACVPLQAYDAQHSVLPALVLISRGDCDFVTKVQIAQDAGYAAAIIYNDEDDGDLVTSKWHEVFLLSSGKE